MDLCNVNTIKSIINRHGFTFSKSLGQNFIIDGEICPKMAQSLGDGSDLGVIEIGTGIGTLTKELCKAAKRVVAVELDKRLLPVLSETLSEFNNYEVINADVLELDLNALIKEKLADCKSVKVCANLPYYITSPVIMTLLEKRLDIDEIVVMVQLEAGERICADVGTRLCGAVTVSAEYYAKRKTLFFVGRECFMPSPNVDSVVISLEPRKENPYAVKDEKKLFTVVKCAFSQRRKTALNSISNTMGIKKDELKQIFSSLGLSENIRAEGLLMQDYVNIANML